jgi:large subunit ribosomal protein L17
MRHSKRRHKLSRPTGHREALVRNLAKALILSTGTPKAKGEPGDYLGRIMTTEAKAKALRPFIERLITLGKKGTQHHRRLAFSRLQSKEAVTRLFEEIAPKFANRPGGYTRITGAGQRKGDGSWMSYIEFVEDVSGAEQPAPAEAAETTANA